VKTREKPVFSSNQKKVSRGCYSNTQADEVLGTSRKSLKIITEVRCPPRQEAGICADELRHRLVPQSGPFDLDVLRILKTRELWSTLRAVIGRGQ